MAFLRNSTVNLLNLHYGVHALAAAGAGVFFGVFLLRAGVPAAGVLAALALILALRFAIRPLVLTCAKAWGLKPLVMLGTVVVGLQYLPLAHVHGVDWALAAVCVIGAIGDTFYWTGYHAYFAALGDSEHRGHQIGAREALVSLVSIAAPLLGGWALTTIGPEFVFACAAALQASAALPLIGLPNVAIKRDAPGAFAAAAPGIELFATDGAIAAGYLFVWQIALFASLDQDFTAYGGAMALATLVGAASGMALGRWIDRGHGLRAVWLTFAALAFTIALRAASVGAPALAVTANAFGALVNCLYAPTLMTAVYNLAKDSPCVLRFHIATEGAWDLGGGGALLIAATALALGAPFWVGIVLALPGAAAGLYLLRRYYGRRSASAPSRA